MAKVPNHERVTQFWLAGVEGLSASQITTGLPSEGVTGGIVQVTALGGVPDAYTFMQYPVIQVDVWVAPSNAGSPPWGKAFDLANRIKLGIENPSRLVVLGSGWENAYVHNVEIIQDARRIPSDPANYARVSMDILVSWSRRP